MIWLLTELHFRLISFIILRKLVSLRVNPNVTVKMKAIEQYFHVVLFIMLYKVVLDSNSVDKTLVCDQI